jgi:hypothetical protein
MSVAAEFREHLERFLAGLRYAHNRSGGYENCKGPSEIDVVHVIQEELCVEGLLDKTPIHPPELSVIASTIRSLPFVSKVLSDHPHFEMPDRLDYLRGFAALESKVCEMLEYLDTPQPSEASTRKSEDSRTSQATRPMLKNIRTRPRRSPIKKSLNPSERRADTVAKIIEELNVLKPGMTGSELDYDGLRRDHPRFLTFRIAGRHPELKEKVLSLQGNRRHFRLAQELVARKFGRELSTVKMDWKKHKPDKYRQGRKK